VLAGVEGAPQGGGRAVFDSVSVATTFREELKRPGSSSSRSAKRSANIPIWSAQYLGSVVPQRDIFFGLFEQRGLLRRHLRPRARGRALPDGAFHLFPDQTPRIPASSSAPCIVADKGSYVSYLEGCTAPMRDENQLHAAVVELVALDDARSNIRPCRTGPGRREGKGGIYISLPARDGAPAHARKCPWTQSRRDRAITWKYPSCILKGEGSVGEFYSVAVTNNRQQADTGTKMIHIGANSRSTIVSKGQRRQSNNTYRGLVRSTGGRRMSATSPSAIRCCSRQMRRPYRALYRGPQPHRADRA